MTRTFGRYRILEEIGRGGMAKVYLAKREGAEGVEKEVVIKKILPEYAEDERFVEMFISEAELVVDLDHPNIVRVYDFGKVGSDYFLAMEYIDGPNLSELLSACRETGLSLEIGDAVYIAAEIAEALHYAHEHTDASGRPLEIVHRDVTPDNILVSRDGTVKVADFGIAQARHVADEGDVVKGKYRYMSPEQVRGDALDRRSDIFSLGSVLFEMLCDRPLFGRESREETISMVEMAVVPDLDHVAGDVPEPLQRILYRMLERDPEARYQTARELEIRLMEFLYDIGELHDAGTLSEHLERVEARLSRPPPTETPSTPVQTLDVETGASSTRVGGADSTARTVFSDERAESERADVHHLKDAVFVAGRLEGLLELKTELDGERPWRRAVDAYTDVVDSVTERGDGLVHHVDESGFLVVFGVPNTHPDDGLRAARAAREFREAISAINVRLEAPIRLALGIALEKVLVDVADTDDAPQYRWSFHEGADRLAYTLADVAMSTEVLVGSRAAARIENHYKLEQLEEEPDETSTSRPHRLLRPKTRRERIEQLAHGYVLLRGRSDALDRLASTFERTKTEEHPRGCVVFGEYGLGKSTLLQAFLSELEDSPVRRIRWMPPPSARRSPLGMIEDLVLETMGLEATDGPRERREALEQWLETWTGSGTGAERQEMRRDMLALLGAGRHRNGSEDSNALDTEAGVRILEAVLTRASDEVPVVVAVDDGHYLDPASWSCLLEYLDRHPSHPVFVVWTVNRTELDDGEPTPDELDTRDHLETMEIEEMPPEEARKAIEDRLRGPKLNGETLLDDLHRWTGGHPMLVDAFADALHTREELHEPDELRAIARLGERLDPLPTTIEATIVARLDRLPASQLDDVQRLAHLWTPFGLEAAKLALDSEHPDVEPQLEALCEAGILEPYPGEPDLGAPLWSRADDQDDPLYRFCKGLTREVAASSLVPSRAEALHERLVSHLTEQLVEPTASEIALLARHTEGAGATKRAAERYIDAAEAALDALGTREALRLAERALESTPDASRRVRRIRRFYVRALERLGQIERAAEHLPEPGDGPPLSAEHEERIDAWLQRVQFHRRRGELNRARSALERVRDKLDAPAQLDDAHVELHALDALIELREGRRERAERLCRRAFEECDTDDVEPEAVGRCFRVRALSVGRDGDYDDALDHVERGLEFAERTDRHAVERRLRCERGRMLVRLGRLDDALTTFEASLEEATRLDDRRGTARCRVGLGRACRLAGRFERAIEVLRQGLYRARQTDMERFVAKGLVQLGSCYLETGRYRAADRTLHQGLRIADSIPDALLGMRAMFALARAQLRDDDGDVRTGLVQAEDGIERAEDADIHWGPPYGHALAADLASALDRSEVALDHSEHATEALDGSATWIASNVWYRRARVLEAERDDDGGGDHERALEHARDVVRTRAERIDDTSLREDYLERPVPAELLEHLDEDVSDLRPS